MKLISLNTWGGKYFDPLINFLENSYQTTDIYCFQEVYDTPSDIEQYKNIIRANLLNEFKRILNGFQAFYDIEITGFDDNADPVTFHLTVGKAIFIRKNIEVNGNGSLLLSGEKEEKFLKKDFSNLPVTLQYVTFTLNDKHYLIVNFHGTSFPGSKLDTNLRIEHSKKISDFLANNNNSKILVGDFNLLPETESIKMLEKNMRNLIKQFNIPKTRSSLSPFSQKSDFQRFADYIFVSPDVNVLKFEVPDIAISDHLPMIVEFS